MEFKYYYATRQLKKDTQEYVFYYESEKIGTATTITTNGYSIIMRCNGMFLECRKEPVADLRNEDYSHCVQSCLDYRGYSIYDADCGELYARLIWGDDINKLIFMLDSPFGEYQVVIQDGFLAFAQNNSALAAIGIIEKDSPFYLEQQYFKDPDWEPCLVMNTQEVLPNELAVLMLGLRLILWNE